jgi:GNAT superfamily N-acetyltransferase
LGELTPPAALPPLRAPEPLAERHDLAPFDCGNDDLNRWLKQRARPSEGRSARTIVLPAGNRVVGYYCLAAGAVERASLASARLRRNLPEPIPVLVLGRLARDRALRGRGIGAALLQDAILRCLEASRIIGVRAIVAHAVDERAAAFYRRYQFLPSPLAALTFVLPIETAQAAHEQSP